MSNTNENDIKILDVNPLDDDEAPAYAGEHFRTELYSIFETHRSFIYSNHKDQVYIPDLGEVHEAKINHNIYDVKSNIKRAIQSAQQKGVKRFSIQGVNERASGLLASALLDMMRNDDTALENLILDIGFGKSKYGDTVLAVNVEDSN